MIEIGILTSTYNRTEYLRRLSKSLSGCKATWFVSDANPCKENEKIVSHGNISSFYLEQPEAAPIARQYEQKQFLLKKAKQLGCNYILSCNDDDMVNTSALNSFVTNWENPVSDTKIFMGKRVDFWLDGPLGNIQRWRYAPYPFDAYAKENIKDRWTGWLKSPFSVEYSIVDIDLMLELYKHFDGENVWYYGEEMFVNLAMLAKSKIHQIDDVLFFQQKHPKRANPFRNRTMYDSICDPNWSKRFVDVRNYLKNITKDDEFVDEALFFHIKCMANSTWEAKHSLEHPAFVPSKEKFSPKEDYLIWLDSMCIQ